MLDFNINTVLALILWWVLLWSLSMQLYASLTAKGPNKWIGIGLSIVVASGALWLLNYLVPLSVSLLSATIAGVYGDFAIAYVIGMLALSTVFVMNIFYCWQKDQPIWIFQ